MHDRWHSAVVLAEAYAKGFSGIDPESHDVRSYMEMFGGPAAFERKLDELFTTSSELPADAPPDIAGLVGQYAHGNEPSHHIAYLYAYCGAHHKTQSRVRMLLKTMHRAEPDGSPATRTAGR